LFVGAGFIPARYCPCHNLSKENHILAGFCALCGETPLVWLEGENADFLTQANTIVYRSYEKIAHYSEPSTFKARHLRTVNDSLGDFFLDKRMVHVKRVPQIASPPLAGGDKGEGETISN
jgi:hypothetical protein